MKLKDLKEFIKDLPKEFDEYDIVNGEVGQLIDDAEDNLVFRVDKPIIALYVDEKSNEICFFHQTQEDVNNIWPENKDNDGDTEELE